MFEIMCTFYNALQMLVSQCTFVLFVFFSRCKNEYLTAFHYLSAVMSNPVPRLKNIVQSFLDKELMRASKAMLANKCRMLTHREIVKHGQNVDFKDSGVEDKVNGSVRNRLVKKHNFCGEINDGVSVQPNETQQDYSRPKNFSTKTCVVDLCKFKAKQETYKIGCFLSIRPHQHAN